MQPFTLLIKPAGSDCNLDCKYCFYKNRAPEIGTGKQRMSDEVLEKLTKDYLQLGFPRVCFAWQGGEPMLMGLDFYKRAVELQEKYKSDGQWIDNGLQTNAVLIDDEWAQFLHDNNFLVGISLDGPKEYHDYYRVDHAGGGSFDKVIRAIENCKKHKVEFNILILLNNKNVEHPDEVFDFCIEQGTKFLQFIPCIEAEAGGKIADFSITPAQYGEFMCRIFDRWCEYGPEKLSIRDFDSVLSFCLNGQHTLCTFSKQCSQYIVIEHSGDVFPCDFFVEPKWLLGNIFETPIGELAGSEKKKAFAREKQNLCNKCLLCSYLNLCRGGCMKDKIAFEGQSGQLSYLCEGYKRFFDYALPKFMQIAATINPAAADKQKPF